MRQSESTQAFARRVEDIRAQYGTLSAYLHVQKPAAQSNRPSRFVRIEKKKLAAA
jgi:hypothetical protein